LGRLRGAGSRPRLASSWAILNARHSARRRRLHRRGWHAGPSNQVG
jgi:hypothetical protein